VELKSRLDEFERLNAELKSELSKVVDYTGLFNGIIENSQASTVTMTETSVQADKQEDLEKVTLAFTSKKTLPGSFDVLGLE